MLDAVLFDLLTEEPQPSHEALLRWISRYPELSDELAGFFAAWAVSSAMAP